MIVSKNSCRWALATARRALLENSRGLSALPNVSSARFILTAQLPATKHGIALAIWAMPIPSMGLLLRLEAARVVLQTNIKMRTTMTFCLGRATVLLRAKIAT
jgi:hypothetical protein